MAVSVPAYTALEALLLFQCLKGFGVEPAAFTKAADLLQANPDIAAHRDYHRARLTPDALRAFYHDRLRAELDDHDHDDHQPIHDHNHDHDDNTTPPPANPRKPSSPAHHHLIPKLVDKLYATYRLDITTHIRADEARFDALQRDIAALDHPSHPHPHQPVAPHNGPHYPHISPHPHPAQPRAAHPHSPASRPPHGPHLHPQPIQPYVAGPVNGPPQFPPAHHRFPHQQPLGPHSPGVQTPQQHKAYFPQHMAQPPPQAGFMLPPFQVSPQDPSRVHHPPVPPPQHPHASTPLHNRPQPAASASASSACSKTAVQTPASGKPNAAPHPLITQARHSLSTPSTQSPTSTAGTPRSVRSVWKKKAGTPTTPRPEIESLDDFVPLVSTKQSPSKPKSQRKGRGRPKVKESEPGRDAEPTPDTPQPNEHIEEPAAEPGTRQGRSRRKVPAKRTRPGSIASSRAGGSTRDRSRSQSILSHTETVADTESQPGNRIKSERGTSVDHLDDEAVETPSHMSTRRRGGVQGHLSTKRKRAAREASVADSEDQVLTPGPARTVVAHRNFPRTCQPIMDDIASHKHASIFTTAVRPKDAPGYYDVIKCPKDLSNIKKGIATGAKVVSAAAADTPIGSPGGAGGTIELPLTHETIPPRAIVNPAQLEKELVHMFVNAVMFNPGEEGVVEDAREMYETVQQSVSSWRNVGRSSGRLEIEDTPVAEDEEEVKAPKRRKV